MRKRLHRTDTVKLGLAANELRLFATGLQSSAPAHIKCERRQRGFLGIHFVYKRPWQGVQILTPEKLRRIYGDVSPHAAAKAISHFDKHCRQFIEHSTFLVLATSDGTNLDVSPKGDPAGFVKIENEKTLLIPDRPGNNRIDGLLNILAHPKVAIFFMIPSVTETLRVNGIAEICDNPNLCDEFKINGRSPKTVLRVTAEEIFTHCGKAPMRAGLWRPETWPTDRPIPSLYEMIQDHSKMEVASTEQSYAERRYRETLY